MTTTAGPTLGVRFKAAMDEGRTRLSSMQRTAQAARIPILNGALARVGLTLALFPLDTVKTRAQLRTAASLPRPQALLRSGWSITGSKVTLLRGAPVGALAAAGAGALSFVVYTSLARGGGDTKVASVSAVRPPPRVGASALIAAEVVAGAWAVPLEGMKTRVQAGIFDGVGGALRGALAAGPLALYAGGVAHVAREVASRALFVALAARSAQLIAEKTGKTPGEGVSAAATGALVGIATTPLDVLRTRCFAQRFGSGRLYGSSLHAAASLVKREGPLAAFRGAHLRCAHLALSAGLFAVAYRVTESTLSERKWLWYAEKAPAEE